MADSTIRMIGEGTLADIIAKEIRTYRPQSIDLGLGVDVFREKSTYFRNYAISLQGRSDRNLSGRVRTTKGISVDEIFRNLGSMLPQNYELTDSVPNCSSGNAMEHSHIVLKNDSPILGEDAVINDEASIQQVLE